MRLFPDVSEHWWKDHWLNMPRFTQNDLSAFHTIKFDFTTERELRAFFRMIDRPIPKQKKLVRSIWYPGAVQGSYKYKFYTSDAPLHPRYPVYVVSKSRAKYQFTSRYLSLMRVKHYVVVEKHQHDEYVRRRTPYATILILDSEYQRRYNTCDNLGTTKSVGPGAARNFVADHSRSLGAAWHWVMDDNIRGFFRLNDNFKIPVRCATYFRAMEIFVERYTNVSMAGPNYFMFAPRKDRLPPFVINTRIYSCNLIRNKPRYDWRGRYNEDTDISIRMLRDGYVTVQFNAFLQDKLVTQKVPGGNTKEFYAREGTLPKSQMIVDLHPDVARLTWRFGRWHHYVDYSVFRNRLKFRSDVVLTKAVDEMGMQFYDVEPLVRQLTSRARTRAGKQGGLNNNAVANKNV